MIIAVVSDGLGNQLFQYAAGRALVMRLGTELKLDASHFEGPQRLPGLENFKRSFKLPSFNIDAEIATPEEISAMRDRMRRRPLPVRKMAGLIRRILPRHQFGFFIERTPNYDPVITRIADNTYLRGYWQSEQYFLPIADTIRKELTVKDQSITQRARQFLAARRGGKPIVGVHVRRGDLAYAVEKLKDPSKVHGPPVSVDYLRSAMAQFDPASRFIVASDDIEWCKANLHADNMEFAQGASDLDDFETMRACDHNIIANSTFGWWAAWLNDTPGRRVIAPRKWFFPERFPGHRMESLIPPNWKLL